MTASALSGPQIVYGGMTAIPPGISSAGPVPDYNLDAGPSMFYQGQGILDARYFYPKDKVTGFPGAVAAHYGSPILWGSTGIPSAASAVNIASVASVAAGVPLALAGGSYGVAANIPIRPFTGAIPGGAPVTVPVALDFGSAYAATTAGSNVITVSNGNDFYLGMPVVIAAAGNAAGTTPLLTNVTAISGTTVTLAAPALFTSTGTPAGSGDLWGPSVLGFPTPQAALPFIAAGSGLFFDPRQAISRGVKVTGVAGGTGGSVTVRGYDVFHQAMSETIAVGAGAVTSYGRKAFKYIASVTPAFSDAHTYTVGTSDVFGISYRCISWDRLDAFWAGLSMVTSTGFTGADNTNPATSLTGDVRGTIQTSANGGGTGIGATGSNGTLTGVTVTGNRLSIALKPIVSEMISTTPTNTYPLYGVMQA